jgi:hypothetical protein
MKLLGTIFTLLAGSYGVWLLSNTYPEITAKILHIVDSGFDTLEAQFDANQIMEMRRKELLKNDRYRYLEPTLEFYPYLLMEVKYTSSEKKTQETVILWDLTDGEMVLDTKNWDKTHGFGDCIAAGTTTHEFKILNTLAKKEIALDKEALSKALNMETKFLELSLDSCLRKNLIVQMGNSYKLHFEKPKFRTIPQTQIDNSLGTKSCKDGFRLRCHFSKTQIERAAKSAFGQNFVIRKITDVYLPVYTIVVQSPDGSLHTSRWNGLNSKKFSRSTLID